MTPASPPLALVLSVLGACAPEPDFGGASVDVAACAGDADLDDALSLALAFEGSAQEMVVCGAITYQFLGAVVGSAVTFAEGDPTWQERMSFNEGTYRVEGTGVAMDLVLSFGPDSPGDAAGSPLEASVFVSESWLVGASTEQAGEDLVVSFDEPGPLAGLLGKGAVPESPLTFSTEDLDAVALALTTLELEGRVVVDDDQPDHRFRYRLDTPRTSIETLILERVLEYELEDASGQQDTLEQSATFETWDLRYLDGPNPTLQGTVTFDVTGGPFSHAAQYLYLAEDPDPTISITCL